MKKWKERGKRIAVLLLTAALVGSSVDLSALTVNAAEEEKVLTCEKEEQTTSEEITETAKRITSWTWNDEEEMLDLEENVLALPGASKDYIVSFDDIVSFLPASITATITTSASVTETEDTEATNESEETDGAEETVTLEGWVCENYPEEGAYSGNYTFTANLPEGYELAEDAAALKVNVELGGAQLLEATTITPTQPSEGDGSVENPYQITSAAELYWFAGLVNGTLTDGTQNNSACAKLMNDITVNDNLLKNITYKKDESGNPTNEVTNGENFISWTPIGANGSAYQGTFDGNGQTISGLFFNDSTKDYVGLFANICEATIRNVGVVDSYFFGEYYVGGVCAFGVDGTITGSYNTGGVSGNGDVGGVCGVGIRGTITDSYNTGSVSGEMSVGGVCGEISDITITNCYYLKAEGTNLGGIGNADDTGKAEGKTVAQFASGEVAYLLQDGQTEQVWGQNIDNDGEKQSFPVFSNAKVYKPSESSPCKAGYTNNAEGLKEHDFGDDKTGESCSNCSIKNINYSGISISSVDTLYYYTGNEIKPDITVKNGETSLTLGEDYNITYGNNTSVAESNAENAPYVKITGTGNYAGEITKNFTIAYIAAPDNYITGTKGANDWYTSDVTIGVADWQVSTDNKSTWQKSISVTEEGTHSYTLYFKDSNGYITDSISKEIKIDKAAPTGTIKVKESTWDKFLETITFGFCTNTKEKIEITSKDTGSGIASTEYLVSEKAYTQISDVQNLRDWADYNNSKKPVIKTNRTNYVYARITDNVGNVTYLSSDGILHDDEKPFIFDRTPVMKDRSGSVTFEIFEDGSGLENVYFLYSTDMDKVTSATTENLKASDYHNATGTFTLSDLKPNTEYYCAVLAVDKAGNESYLLNSTFKTLKEAITGTVSISGEAVYGKTLTASYEGLATDAGEVTVSWYRGEDTTAIATGDTYTLTADDVGKVITVKVTAANCSGELTDSTAEVAKAEHPNPPTNGKVDDENNTFTFNGTSGVTYEYSTDGGANWTDVTVDSGTGVGTVTVGNVIVNIGGLQVRAKETDGYKASDVISNTSAYTATLEGSVSLSGTAKYGETLTATVTGAQQGAVLTYTFSADDTVLQQGSSNTYKIEQEAIGKQITVKVSAEGYIGTVNNTSDTVAKADGVLTLKQTEFTQTFGDEAFELGCSRTGDGTISYKVSDEKVIKVSDTGEVTIVGAGSATVTVSLSETECYTGAAEQTIKVNVAKKDYVLNPSTGTAAYTYKQGASNVAVDVAGMLPADKGNTTYSVSTTDASTILENVSVLKNGNLTYDVKSFDTYTEGITATIAVTATMANYKDVTYTLTVKITDKFVVTEKAGAKVSSDSTSLVYGQKISALKLNTTEAKFVANGTEVAGTLSWETPDEVLNAGSHQVIWKFVPENEALYQGCTGTITVTVSQATPNVTTVPTVADRVYHSTAALTDSDLVGGSVSWTVGGVEKTVTGTWSWKTAGIVPTVKNSGYVAVFTPTDRDNYNPVEKKVTVKVAKATDYIGTVSAEPVSNTLDISAVTLSRTDTSVKGKLMLTDSKLEWGKTRYNWKFVPEDTTNYEELTGKVTVTIKDNVAPEAEYQIDTNGFKKFINTITFGKFCKDYKTVTITYTDATSGIATKQYYISDKEIKDASATIADTEWKDYTGKISLNGEGTYFIYVKAVDNAGNTVVANSEGIVIYKDSVADITTLSYTYKESSDKEVGISLNGNTIEKIVNGSYTLVENTDYTVQTDNDVATVTLKKSYLDTLKVSDTPYSLVVSFYPQGVKAEIPEGSDKPSTATIKLTVNKRELTVTGATATDRNFDGTDKVNITAVTLDGVVTGEDVSVDVTGLQGTLNGSNAGTYNSVTLPTLTLTGENAANYTLKQPTAAVSTNVTINKLSPVITVPRDTFDKTFGDAAFKLDVTEDNPEADVTYTSDNTDVAAVSSDGTVTIKGAGKAIITVSLGATTNCNAAESKTITINVAKKDYVLNPSTGTAAYTYKQGASNVAVDVAGMLPADKGNTTYSVSTTDASTILENVSVLKNGNLTYDVKSFDTYTEGITATIAVTATMANYKDVTYTLTVKITDKFVVTEKAGAKVSSDSTSLVYGQKISALKLNTTEAKFVANGTEVAGTLSWETPDEVLNAGSHQVIWKFVPENEALYQGCTGTITVTVSQATPNVTTVPTVADRVYHPTAALTDSDLVSGSVSWTVGGVEKTVEGSWSWKTNGTVPTTNVNSYVAVFNPTDTTNYVPVTKNITVRVVAATAYVAEKPTVSAITYGQTLSDATIAGGKVQYSENDTTLVDGTFSWKDASLAPNCADSNLTTYVLVFTPTDRANYNTVETDVTITVNKVKDAPHMPGSAMSVPYSNKTVGTVTLAKDWTWQESDKATALEVGVPVTATAVYNGADKGNYENESVVITITRSDCEHKNTEVRGEKESTCKEEGYSGDTYCKDCGECISTGHAIEKKEHSGGTATCTHKAKCSVCGAEYGTLNPNNHEAIKLVGKKDADCTSSGYTGDKCCSGCNAVLEKGKTIAATGHDYHSEITRQPTTTAEGERTYTCVNCNDTYTETIPKLPEEEHEHNYTCTITREATCTQTGIKTYTCKCGDSYTETIPKLNHKYTSSVTVEATKEKEGEMTYTCSLCGHSYTKPIAKLKDDNRPGDNKPGDNKPGNNKPGDNKPGEGGDKKPAEIPDTGKPFIKDETGKEGWDVIKNETSDAKDGDAVKVDMNGATVVPGDVLDTIAGKDVTIVFDMGNGITWSVNGNSITTDKVSDIDFSVKVGEEAGNNIPVDVINNVTGERYSIQISLAYDGEFGFTAVLSINMEAKNVGLYANLFYYNETTGELEFICADEIAEDGTADLTFTHASDYTIVIDEAPMDGNGADDSTGTGSNNVTTESKEDSWNPLWIIIIGAIVIVAGLGIFFIIKKKEDKEDKDNQ